MRELSPIVRAVLDARDEAIVIVDARGGTLYLNAAARATQPQAHTPSQFIVLGEVIIVPRASCQTWADQERAAIQETLRQTGGNCAETARRLGISRTTLWRRLKAERS